MLQDVLKEWGACEVSPMDVYTDMFKLGEGYLQQSGEPSGEYKSNPVGYFRNKGADKGHFRVLFEDTFEETLKELQEADGFSILNGITYFGRRNVQEHASKMFSLIFDLDGVTDKTLNAFLSGAVKAEAYPVPNYIALSGHGVHLYYLFEEPISLYPYIKLQLKELKYALTDKMWNPYTSTEEKVQHQGINQGFRVLGGKTKENASERTVRAFRLNTHPFSLDQLCEYVPEQHRVDREKLWKEKKYTLKQAQKKFPEWYQKVVVNGDRSRTYWDISEKVNGDNPYALYDWWKRQIRAGATYRHRYFAIMCLAIYGVKCRKPYEEVEADALALVPFLNEINPEEPFTKNDCLTALECYDSRYCTFPIKDIEKISGISVPRNKRNGRKQKQHVRVMNAIRDVVYPDGEWREGNGRPKGSGTAQKVVWQFRSEHPKASKAECNRVTGLDPKTIRKWWDVPFKEEGYTYHYTPDGVKYGAIQEAHGALLFDKTRKNNDETPS